MNYEDKSDYEINCRVALYLGHRVSREHECIETGSCFILTKTYGERIEFNPCNNPNHAEPIIIETCMTIELAHPLLGGIGTNTIYNPRGMDWQCDYIDNSQWMRAAMICFLNMKDEEEENNE